MKFFVKLTAIALTIGLQSCFLKNKSEITVVKSILTNQITGEVVDGVPIQVWECSSGFMQNSNCDSLTSILTSNGGYYEISFTNKKGRFYQLGIGRNEEYTSSLGIDGYPLQEGKTNTNNLTTIPYQILKVEIETSKQKKNFINLEFRTADANGDWVGGSILVDTVKQHQTISTTRFLKVLPQRNYKISKRLCNRSGVQIQDYVYSDCVIEWLPDFYVPYQDTLTIKVE